MVEQDLKFLIIVSGKAGQGRALNSDIRDLASKSFAAAGLSSNYEILVTEHESHLSEAARQFANEHGSKGVVYVAGGDGSLNEVAQAIYGTGCAFGAIPAGTGNDFVKTIFGKKRPPLDRIINAMPRPEFKQLDLIRLKFPPGVTLYNQYSNPKMLTEYCPLANSEDGSISVFLINVVSFGLDTLVLRSAYKLMAKRPKLGGKAYYLGVLKNLGSQKVFPTNYRFTLSNGEIVSGKKDYITTALCNGGYYGNGFNPAPMADLFDGALNLCEATWMGALRFVPLILRYLNGKHITSKFISFREVKSGEFLSATDDDILGNYDGLLFRTPSFSFEVMPQALPFARLKI
ncbi:MAG TPA: hypothetical protein GXZ59_02580 [Clostridiaceae bacterium]|nr:hypothetical protein [Clostridiaceae bacterium]